MNQDSRVTSEMLGGSCILQLLLTVSQTGHGNPGFLDVTHEWLQVAEGDKGHQWGVGQLLGAAGSSEGRT